MNTPINDLFSTHLLLAGLLLTGCASQSASDTLASASGAAQGPAAVQVELEQPVSVSSGLAQTPDPDAEVPAPGLQGPRDREEFSFSRREGVPDRRTDEVIENPPINEQFLFSDPVRRTMSGATVQQLPGSDEIEPIFDHVGEQAKSSYIKGALLNQKGFTTQAYREYLAAVENDPDNLWLKNRAADAALYHNDLPTARRLAEEVLEAEPQNYRAMLTLADMEIVRGRSDDAAEWFKQVIEIKPRNIAALENLARLSFENRDYEATKQYCAEIMQVTSRNLNAILWHAEASALTGDIQYAAELYERLTRYRPTLIARLAEMGIRLLRQGRLEDSIELFRRGVVIQPESEMLRVQYETLLRETGGEDAVRQGYTTLAEENPLEMKIQEIFADYLSREGSREEMIAQRRRMLEVEPRHIPSLMALGRDALENDNIGSATDYFDRAISAGPSDASIFREIAAIYMDQGDFEKAEELLTGARANAPEDAENFVAIARLADLRGDKEEAEEALKRAIDLAPANAEMLQRLGSFYRREGRLREASALFEQVIAVDKSDPAAQLSLARIYLELEDDEALKRLEEDSMFAETSAVTFFPDYGYLAMSYGNWDRARWAFAKALEEFPNNLEIRRALATVYLHLGEEQLAEETLLRGRDNLPEDATEQQRRAADFALLGHYQLSRNHQKALEVVRSLMQDQPEDFDLARLELEALANLGLEEEVNAGLNRLVRQFGAEHPVETKIARADVFRILGNPERGMGVLAPLADSSERTNEVMFTMALLASETEDLADAERYYGYLLENIDPTGENAMLYINSANNLAFLYANKDTKLARAEELAREALELYPNADYILDTLGWVLFRKGEYEEAEDMLKKAEKLALPDPEIYEHLGELYRQTDRRELAIEYFEKALALDEDAAHLQARIDELQTAIGEATGATPANQPAVIP